MIFDIGVCIILLVFFLIGYNKGLMSMVLSLGLSAVSFLVSFYVSSKWLYLTIFPLEVPYGNLVLQAMIMFVILSALSTYLVKKVDFEEIVIVGTISRVLGGILYIAIAIILILAITTFCIFFQLDIATYTADSFIYEWIYNIIENLIISKLALNTL